MTNSVSQNSGLGVCLKLIAEATRGTVVLPVDNIEHMKIAISRMKPKKVILEGISIITGEQAKILRSMYPSIDFYLHLHSNIPFLSEEPYSFHKIKELQAVGVRIILNSVDAHKSISDSIFLPNIYVLKKRTSRKTSNEFLDIACPGSIRPMKNIPMQVLAAKRVAEIEGKKLRFHINANRQEGGETIKLSIRGIRNLYPDIEIVEVPWIDHISFIDFLTTMDAGMQVSMTETFNIVSADFCSAGIPMVVSNCITWTAKESQANPNDFSEIVRILSRSLRDENLIEHNQYLLQKHTKEAIALWGEFAET